MMQAAERNDSCRSTSIVCVMGMHRSGTSIAMRLVNLLGIDVGPEPHLVPAGAANPKGFWEHQGIVELNEKMLRRLGGNSLRPPRLDDGWETASRFDDLRARGRQLIAEDFGQLRKWGWKDPRSSLTLPFWHTVVEPTHYVLCVRDPRNVARSLQQRDRLSRARALQLWLSYTRSSLRTTRGRKRICIVYERIMDDCLRELSRLASFLGEASAAADEVVRQAARSAVDRGLQHHHNREAPASDQAADPVDRALRPAIHAYDELSGGDSWRQDEVDRLLEGALALVTPVVEEEEREEAVKWDGRRREGILTITAAVPKDASFILVDAMQWATEDRVDGRHRIPFLEREGQYWGPPPDDETAIRELCRLRDAGAAFVAIAEPAFPWLDHYRGLTDWLRRSFPCVVESELAIVFDLRPIGHRRAAGRDRDA